MLESISFLTYFGGRLPADAVADDNVLLLKQGDSIRQIDIAEFFEALAVEAGGGAPVTLATGAVLGAAHGTVFGAPDDGVTIEFHLPVYASVTGRKGYKIKNIGQGIIQLDAADGKTIDGELLAPLAPGDRCTVVKDGANWQTI